jgi:DNA adenine methylase
MDFQPIIKWSGSKRIQSEQIISYFPKYMGTYYEPFCGGCSVLYQLMVSDEKFARDFVCSDTNPDLIDLWNVVKNNPEELFDEYSKMWSKMQSMDNKGMKRAYFEEIRNEFNRTRNPMLFFFIMRTCTNGIPRYNKHKEFNGTLHLTRDGIKPKRLQPVIMDWSELLNVNEVTFKCCDYKDIFEEVEEGDFLYLDPPYDNTRINRYFGRVVFDDFFNQLRLLNTMDIKFVLSFDGKSNGSLVVPIDCYINKVYIDSKNSSFRRTKEGMTNKDVFESLYWN